MDTRPKQARYATAAGLHERLVAQLNHYIDKEGGTYGSRKSAFHLARAAETFVAFGLAPPQPAVPAKGRRGRPPGTKYWVLAAGKHSTRKIAEAILAECWQTWLHADRSLPTTLTVAKGIARRLDVHGDQKVQVGRALLNIAEIAKVVREVRTHYKVPVITFTDEVETLLCNHERAAEEFPPPGTGFHPQPIAGAVAVQRGRDQLIAPLEPTPGTSPWDAAERVRATRWQVNRVVCTVAGEWLQAQMDKLVIEEGVRAALKNYGTIRDAYQQARKVEAGYIAVRWDYRGRLNQADSALTYTSGSDLARSVLEFAETKPVRTVAGRLALARHLINQYSGEDARSVTQGGELDWIHSHRGEIGRIADHCIMTDASHPLRLIAACRAWRAAERGEPIGLPVSIDATTSMLQHMALLLRDERLARLSNLWPGERQDFYTRVAEACGSERKVVKSVAMPMFYGQTSSTGMDVLRRHGVVKPQPLVTKIHEEGARIAPGAFALYQALRAVAKQLTAAGQPISWTTPSGWLCTTDRRRADRVRHTVALPDGAVRQYTEEVPGTELHLDNQCNAITANLIHSLDASLLHLAVAALPERVKSIAVAHDCFATHADDVPTLRATLMQTLEQMYGRSDLLARWWSVWADQGVTVPCPERGTWSPQFVAGEYAFV
jgi:hypothetical protein